MRKYKKYTPEFKIQCAKEVLEGEKSQMEIATENDMTDRNIRRWVKKAFNKLIISKRIKPGAYRPITVVTKRSSILSALLHPGLEGNDWTFCLLNIYFFAL